MATFGCPPTGYQLSISTYLALKTKQIEVSEEDNFAEANP